MAQFWERISTVGREGTRQTLQNSSRLLQRFSLLNCCVTPQSEIARVRIDRSMIGDPINFRHIGHVGADEMSGASDVRALNCLLASKGSYEFGIRVPESFRLKDVPITAPARVTFVHYHSTLPSINSSEARHIGPSRHSATDSGDEMIRAHVLRVRSPD